MKFEKPIAEIQRFGLKDFISASSEAAATPTTVGPPATASEYGLIDTCFDYYSKNDSVFDNCL